MSNDIIAEKPAIGRVDRFLSALRLGKQDTSGDADTETIQVVEELVFNTENLVPLLVEFSKFASPVEEPHIQLTGYLSIKLTLKLTGELRKQDEKSDLFRKHITILADRLLNIHGPSLRPLIDEMLTVLENLNADVGTSPGNDIVQKAFASICVAKGKELSHELENQSHEYLASNKAIKKAYRKYQLKCAHDVAIDIVVIVAVSAATGASWGATGPVAVVAVARSCAGLGVKLFEMALSAGQTIKVIEGYFAAVGTLMTVIESDEDNPQAAQKNAKSALAMNTTIEFVSGAIAGITNLPMPSIEKIGDLMGKLESKLAGLHTEMLEWGKEMTKMRKTSEAYDKKIGERITHKEDFDAEKHQEFIAECLKQYKKMEKHADHLLSKIEKYLGRQAEFEEQLALYKKSQKSWSRQSRPVFGFATSVGLSVGSGTSDVEFGLAAMNEVLLLVDSKLAESVLSS